MVYKRTPRVAWNDQKKSAIKRGVEWHFTFEQWVIWWEAYLGSNWFRLRGHKTGQYVMARNGDTGPYKIGNVRCVKVEDNHNEYNSAKPSQANKTHRKRLNSKVVIDIYKAKGTYAVIAQQHGLDTHAVHRIKCGKCYVKVTAGIEKG